LPKILFLNYFTSPYVTGSTLYQLCQDINNTYIVIGTTTDSRYKCDRCNINTRECDNTHTFEWNHIDREGRPNRNKYTNSC